MNETAPETVQRERCFELDYRWAPSHREVAELMLAAGADPQADALFDGMSLVLKRLYGTRVRCKLRLSFDWRAERLLGLGMGKAAEYERLRGAAWLRSISEQARLTMVRAALQEKMRTDFEGDLGELSASEAV